jgi:predicted O-methyltransferase YrrM
MEFIEPAIQAYSEAHTTPESEVLQKLHRDTHTKVLMPRMLSGHLQGRLLSQFSHMLRPKSILEIGTYTGYSAICLAEGLADGGKLITIDKNEELEAMMRKAWHAAGLSDVIELHLGDARAILPGIPGPFDLVFIDADKKNYLLYYQEILPKVRPGGIILADNVLWSGKVANPESKDVDTLALREFNAFVANDPRVETLLLPIRDGIMMARKL